MRIFCTFFLFFICLNATAQNKPDVIYMKNIKTIKLFQQNHQESLPILNLNSFDQLELHFDDLDAYAKSYYYTFELCDANWQPADLSPFDYIKGFTQNVITQYRHSSEAFTQYIHYQLLLPESSCIPSKSGNYLLKIFLNGDIKQLAFTKRFFVLDNKASIIAKIEQPFDAQLYYTHQKIQFSVNTMQLNPLNPQQQVKVSLLQNYRWDNAVMNIQPAFLHGRVLEYNGEQDCLFPSGKEYRWADLRSFRYESERVASVNREVKPYEVYMRPDLSRAKQSYISMKDYDGWYAVGSIESVNPWWQTDYANVNFSFVPDNHQPYVGKDVYLIGELTGNTTSDDAKMQYNADKGVYEKTLMLKQGYYDYIFAAKNTDKKTVAADVTLTEGNNWETENEYTIFVYFRSLSGRYDELVAYGTINTLNR